MENPNEKQFEKDLGAVWVKKAASGAQFISLSIDLNQWGINQKVNLVAFKNKGKKEPKHPDFKIYLSNREGNGQPAPAAASPAPKAQAPAAKPAAAPVLEPTELDI
jgi:uncharacterized protein (DUF736 family)